MRFPSASLQFRSTGPASVGHGRWLALLLIGACGRPVAAVMPASAPGDPATPVSAEAPNANAAHYGPHGVASTPPAPADPAAPQAMGVPPSPGGGDDTELADLRGHACQCGKSCHCGHCSGAVPGCHCKVKRADDPGKVE